MALQNAQQAENRPTADRILDAAEALFASKGYKATALGDVADQVGIRAPSLYNHFQNKEALYHAVLNRLLARLRPLIQKTAHRPPFSIAETVAWAAEMVEFFFAHPNLARLMQHAALAPAPGTETLLTETFRPLFEPSGSAAPYLPAALQPAAASTFINILVAYITMAPLYRALIAQDPFSPEAKAQHHALVRALVESLLQSQEARL